MIHIVPKKDDVYGDQTIFTGLIGHTLPCFDRKKTMVLYKLMNIACICSQWHQHQGSVCSAKLYECPFTCVQKAVWVILCPVDMCTHVIEIIVTTMSWPMFMWLLRLGWASQTSYSLRKANVVVVWVQTESFDFLKHFPARKWAWGPGYELAWR